MQDFDHYLQELADHEDEKGRSLIDARGRILVNAGIRLNWIGDAVANPEIRYESQDVSVDSVLFTGTSLAWNKILIDQCERSVNQFRTLMKHKPALKRKFRQEALFSHKPVLLRGPDDKGFYRVVDGMHRFVGAVINNQATIPAFVPVNESEKLPVCEAHVVYDLIRGFLRHANDAQGRVELEQALKLLVRTYANVADLLRERFSATYVSEQAVQEVIGRVLDRSQSKSVGPKIDHRQERTG